MKWCIVIGLFILVSCGQSKSKKRGKENEEFRSNFSQPFEWNRRFDYYKGKQIDVQGFLWRDTIEGSIKKGVYTFYEYPNCYECEELKMELMQDLIYIDLIDSNLIPDSIHAQWRFVKVTGTATEDRIVAGKIERSVYSYPDYESSKYKKLTDTLIESGPGPGEMNFVYLDGIIKPNGISFMDGYAVFSITSTGLEKNISIYIKKGTLHNQVEEILGANGPMIVKVQDQKGNSVAKKKIRLSGIWRNFINQEEAKAAGMVFVESIKIIE